MATDDCIRVHFRRRQLVRDQAGYSVWAVTETPAEIRPAETALLLCDVWDSHTCRGALERLTAMLGRMNELVAALRACGVLIVHAPSETMDFYADSPARKRVLEAPPVEPPENLPHDDPPLPTDTSGSLCDTDEVPGPRPPWTRQNAAIEIDEDLDAISDSGRELYGLYRARGIRRVLILGVHTNCCILNRTFAIKQLVRWGVDVALVRDLTDAMYDPATFPYVSHKEGTRLVIEYIEKFWCPTVTSAELLAGAPAASPEEFR